MGLLLGSGITRPKYPYDMWYGVEGDYSSSDYKLKRVGNLDLHRSLPIQSRMKRFVENPDGSVKYYLHPNDSRKKEGGASAVLDTTDGNVMLEKPEYYFRLEIEGTKWIRAYSEYPLPGFVKMERRAVSPWFATIDITKNIAVSGSWLTWEGDEVARDSNGLVIFKSNAAQFRGGGGDVDADKDGTYNSQLGMARTSIHKDKIREFCKNGTHFGAYRVYNEIAWLQRVEYASLHCQDAYNAKLTAEGFHQGGLGMGCSVNSTEWKDWGNYKPFIPCGVTATLGNNTGNISYTIKGWNGFDKVVQVPSYRGLEVPYGYLWCWADDVLIHHTPSVSIAYVCDDPKGFTSHSDVATTVPNGYEAIAELPRNDGYILTESHSSKGYSFPNAVGATGTTGFCDYLYNAGNNNSIGLYGLMMSSPANRGAVAGFGCINVDAQSWYVSQFLGFRLCRF